jgi:hypothetical protein
LAVAGSYDTLGSRRMPTPNGHLTTSVKSVFDCDQGCFLNEEGEHVLFEEGASGHVTSGHVRPETETSEPRDV